MQSFLRFILLFIVSVYGAGELEILVDLAVELALQQETVIMNGDATVQDLVDVMNERLTDVRRKYDGIVFAGEVKPTTSTLADSGISNGATVSLVKTSISDIELLFEMLSVSFLFCIADSNLNILLTMNQVRRSTLQ